MDYVTTSQVSAFAHEFDALSAEGQALLVTAASRLFDSLCEVSEDFFAEEDGTTEDRDFIGDGTAYLKLPPYVDLDSVTMNEGTIETPDYTTDNLPDYVVQDGMLVVLDKTKQQSPYTAFYPNRYTGWPDGKQIRVGATWGFAFIPSDIVLACVHLALHLWRTGDPAFATISNSEGSAARAITIPQVAQQVIDKYKAKYSQRFMVA